MDFLKTGFYVLIALMPYIEKIALEKARKINSAPSIYGTFAEIGAGQEVVNHFFKAGQASQTVAKSMSAYDMTFSDQIYGRAGRYVSEERLYTMLDHEYRLLKKRLAQKRGHNTQFFAFADTVAVSTAGRGKVDRHHGWMGIRFQNRCKGPYNEMILHVNLLDKTRLQQYEVLGVLGVNLIYSAFYGKKDHKSIIKSLFDNFEAGRVEINVLRCSGNIFKNLNRHQLNLELIYQRSTQALLFQNQGKNILPADALYEKSVLVQLYSPHRALRAEHTRRALLHIKTAKKANSAPALLMNIPVQYLKNKNVGRYLKQQFFPAGANRYVLISDFKQLHALKSFIQKATDQHIFLVLSAGYLNKMLNSRSKTSSPDTLKFFSRLCDSKTALLIPDCADVKPSEPLYHLDQYLRKTKKLICLK